MHRMKMTHIDHHPSIESLGTKSEGDIGRGGVTALVARRVAEGIAGIILAAIAVGAGAAEIQIQMIATGRSRDVRNAAGLGGGVAEVEVAPPVMRMLAGDTLRIESEGTSLHRVRNAGRNTAGIKIVI